jgi:hypothetical protein
MKHLFSSTDIGRLSKVIHVHTMMAYGEMEM